MEVSTECACCGKETSVYENSYAVISSTFEEENGLYKFFMSAGYKIDDAKEFVTKVRMGGEFAVMMKFKDTQYLEAPLAFKQLLDKDIYE